ncbi:MAG TPA: hypothetical protein VFR58_03300 [Flavisolibacter sp.]|nr:hypothetical protein [Flavisolibacter sp.]
MKKSLLLTGLLLAAFLPNAQSLPRIGVKWAPTGLFLGSLSLQGEYNFGRSSLTAKVGIPLRTTHTLSYDENDAVFNMKAISFLSGYRTYLSKKHMRGIYFEPYFKYVHHASDGTGEALITGENVAMNFRNNYNAFGLGAQLGVQFIVLKRLAVDLFLLGPELNIASNHFTATEAGATAPWTPVQASEAEADIRDFLDELPIIRKKATVMVDRNNNTVRADFRGAVPGFRTGISVGLVF